MTDITVPVSMDKRFLFALFSGNLILFTVGNGLLPLAPVYAGQLGADPALTGYYLSFAYIALATGTLTAGWLSDRFQRRKLTIILSGIVSVPVAFLMGQATNFLGLVFATAAFYYLGGIGLTLTSTIAGLFARKDDRGRIFGLLALTTALGALIGGSAFGVVMDAFGFRGLTLAIASILALWPVTGLLLRDRIVPKTPPVESGKVGRKGFGAVFLLFLTSNIIASVIFFQGRLGTSLSMRSLHLSSAAISSTAAVGGGVGLLLSPLLGSLSDRFGRKRPLITCYFAAAAGMLFLSIAQIIWQFWVAASLLSIFAYAGGGLASALVADLVEADTLGRGMSYYSATGWIGGVIGFAATGVALQSLGATVSFVLGAAIILFASLLLLPIKRRSQM